uniref:Nascent polypeptide-associated complex subunit alpha-like UBA domain-containing protein n=1 Tax=Attheya septentrionalis TaxID=420275 RepID=A0A7S2XNJ3_9STRA|mmetsp:Transcript_23647/g.42660  ORF Transcript_23647/g.42660 Transcript_23647/m.42660 type:complete len:166 (+) Transcript_23647:200-697(+)|eukprot:CAMPEP_0198280176 /NCGR_PEP_ID=MMETSP1449-20131203/311_1 /TAXON_ID=420275 /ORGANISM="Attheya septentrionalis, Strain CCMP2084" /LENGTH=165 /DNA_ID=CAMNT_0043975461 /DNA_START=136 /DNA_END=633 /DNA_ORIENTATION=-
MKLSIISSVLFLTAGASAFAPVSQQSRTATSLNLFGGKKGADGAPKAPGMMDQLGMLKKAQEIASKKQKLDQELKVLEFAGTGADGKVTATVVYAPGTNPMNPLPSYDLKAIDIDEAYLESASVEDLSAAVKAAIQSGEEATIKAVNEKMMVLQEDLAGMMGGLQ